MAVRNESVRLSLDDQFTSGMARAAAATALFKRELNDLDGKRVSRELDDSGKSIDRFGNGARKAGPEIDRFSGRLGLLADAAVTLGPLLIPLGAAAIPVLTASLVGLGAAAGGIGATVLAFHGLGDALTALNKYQLAPTAENLQKLRIEQEKLGPAGAQFARYISDLTPVLRDLQNTAREGIFPGLEDGINAFLERGPQVTRIIEGLSAEMGNLARDAGKGLSSEAWTPFFNYVESDARPILDAFAQAAGNVALGVANMLVAFAPLSRDFTGGLVDATQAFADWSTGLDENQGFQHFVAYVSENGPRAAEFLSQLAQAVGGLMEAAAPTAAVVLQVLTKVLEVFTAIASSDAGPALYAAAFGLIAFNRAATLTAALGPRLTASFAAMGRGGVAGRAAGGLGLLAASMTDLDDKAGLANTTMLGLAGLMVKGPWGLAAGASIGLIADLSTAYRDTAASITAVDDALRNGDTNAALQEQSDLIKQITEEHPAEGTLGNWFDAFKGSFHDFTGQTQEMKDRIADVDAAMKEGGDVADLFGESIGQTGAQLRVAAGDAAALSGALADLNGWFDKRDAVIAYKDAVRGLAKGFEDGFGRKDLTNINAVGRSILQVASQMKSPLKRANFLAEARDQLEHLADTSGPKAAAALQKVIDKFDNKGLTHQPIELSVDDSRAQQIVKKNRRDLDILGQSTTKPTIGADDNPFRSVFGNVKGAMREADKLRANPVVTVDPGRSLDILTQIRSQMANIVSKTVTLTVNRVGNALPNFDTGGFTGSGRKHEVAGLVHRGEVVIPQERVRRDWSMLKSRYGDLPGFADGGMVDTYTRRQTNQQGDGHAEQGIQLFVAGAWSAGKALKAMNAALDKSEKALGRQKSKLDELTSRRDSLSSSTTGALLHDPFGHGLAGFEAQNAADAADSAAMLAALQQLVRNGLDPKGALFQALAASGDVNTAQQMAALTSSQLFAEQASFNQTHTLAGQVGQFVGQAAFGDLVKAQTKVTDHLDNVVHHLHQAVKELTAEVKHMGKNVKDGAQEGSAAGAEAGTKAGNNGRNSRIAAASATGSAPLGRRR